MIISRTPLRMSFVGGGTDFEDFYKRFPGRVITTTIDKYFYIGLNSRFDGLIQVSYSETELVGQKEQIKHPLVKAALEETGIGEGLDIVSLSDLPARKTGMGLGASSAFTVGLLNALYNFLGKYSSPDFLAEKACEIEINKAKSPIGKQDQYAVAFGGLNQITFNCDGKIDVEPIYLPPKLKEGLQNHLLLFFTQRERSANTILSQQKQNIGKKFEFLRKMSELVPSFRASLEEGNFRKTGELLHQNWLMKQELASGITSTEIDQVYKKALMAGAWGGKILGAGGGGFLLIMASPERQEIIKQALNNYPVVPFKFSEAGSRIVFRD